MEDEQSEFLMKTFHGLDKKGHGIIDLKDLKI
jgi:hypothetical protein